MASIVLFQPVFIDGNRNKPECFRLFQRNITEPFLLTPTFKGMLVHMRVLRTEIVVFAEIDNCSEVGIPAVSGVHFWSIFLFHNDVPDCGVDSVCSNQGFG